MKTTLRKNPTLAIIGYSVIILVQCAFATVPTDGLVARYLFSGNAQDSGPDGIHGTVHGGTVLTTDRHGNPDSAYQFDGENGYINIPDHDHFSLPTTGGMTISVWLRPDTLQFTRHHGNYIHWMGKGDSGRHEWTFRMYNLTGTDRPNRTSFYLFNNSGGLGAGSYVQEPVTAGEWSHYVAVMSMATDRIYWYKNGVLKDTDAFQQSQYNIVPRNSSAPVRVGSREPQSQNPGFLKGAIDDIHFYNRVLSVAEIHALYNDRGSWMDYPIDENGYVDTGDWLGWVWVKEQPWVWCHNLHGWLYAPAQEDVASGIWGFVPARKR